MKIAGLIATVLLLCGSRYAQAEPSSVTVNRHHASFAKGSPLTRYLSLEAVPTAERIHWHRALMFSVASASRAISLDNHLPKLLQGTMTYHIDLEQLRWDFRDLNKVLERYPYAVNDPSHPLLTFRGDWLISQMADTRDSQAIYLLLYGEKNIPKTDADFLKFWGVDENAQATITIGWSETKSQVNKAGTRFVERFITAQADPLKGLSFGRSLWRTKDSFFVKNGSDPLETLDGTFKHQGRELIVQFPKSGYRKGKLIYGSAQAYLLAGGNADAENKPVEKVGVVVQEAPVRLVEDYHRTLGQSAIINHSSCIICHDAGMKFPTENGLEHLARIGVELHVYDRDRKEQIEAFHLTDAGRQLSRDNEDYAEFVRGCNGLDTVENSKTYKHVLELYRAPLALEDAARELYCTPDDLRLALGYAAANHIDTGGRLAALAHKGETIPRTQWEGDYLKAQAMVRIWKGGDKSLMAGVVKSDKLAAAEAPPEARVGVPAEATTPPPAAMVAAQPPAEQVAQASPQPAARPPAATPEPNDGKVETRLIVNCPLDAVVFLNDRPTMTKGERRDYTTRARPDWRGKMKVRAVMMVNGQQLIEEKEVECRGGETVEVVMDFKTAKAQT